MVEREVGVRTPGSIFLSPVVDPARATARSLPPGTVEYNRPNPAETPRRPSFRIFIALLHSVRLGGANIKGACNVVCATQFIARSYFGMTPAAAKPSGSYDTVNYMISMAPHVAKRHERCSRPS